MSTSRHGPVVETGTRRERLSHLRARGREGLRRFYGHTALSTILPGAGLLGTRARRLGLLLLAVLALLVLFVLWRTREDGLLQTALTLAVDRSMLVLLMVVLAVGAFVWIGALLLTARLTRPAHLGRGDRVLTSLFTIAMCAVVALPTIQGVRYLGIQYSLVGSLFGSGNGLDLSDGEDPWAGIPRVNVLLLGSDAADNREGVRTDSMIVASIDPQTGDAVLIGIPRNLEDVPFPITNPLHSLYPNGYDCGDQCLMNSVWTLAQDNAHLFPGNPHPGLTTTQDVISEITGLQIDHTVIIDLSGFEALVDAMGGLTIDVKQRLPIGGEVINGQVVGIDGWIEPGVQHMDGYHALWYARSRATTSDFSRMRRQRCVTGALLNQVDPVTMLQRYPELAEVAEDHIVVDIPQDDLPAWVELVERVQGGTISSLTFTDDVIDVGHPDYDKMRALVQEAVSGEPAAPDPTDGATTPGAEETTTGTEGTSTPDAPTTTPGHTPTNDDLFSDLATTC